MNWITKIASIALILSLMFSSAALAQKGVDDGSKYGHGEDSVQCIKNLSLYRENTKFGQYVQAYPSWRIVFDECPRATKNIYIDGAKMFSDFIKKEKDPVRREALIDSLMLIYDQRIKYYDEKGNVLGRKAVDLLKYRRTDVQYVQEAYGYLTESIALRKTRSPLAVLATYFTSSLTLYQAGILEPAQVVEDYATISGVLDQLIASKSRASQYEDVKQKIDQNFVASGVATCEVLIDYFGPQYESRKDDIKFLKNVTDFLDAINCRDSELFVKAAEKLYTKQPSSAAAVKLARLFMNKEEYSKAEDYYKKAIEMEMEEDKKADYYYERALANQSLDQTQAARTYAREAIKLRPDWGDPYILIGNLYASTNNCGADDFEKATVYWAAVDKFQQAKSVDPSVNDKANDYINRYSRYYPDVETIFFYGLKEGDPYMVGCWINENTTVRAK